MDKRKIIDILSSLAAEYKILLNNTMEIKKVLLGDLNEDILKEAFNTRGLLIKKMNSSIKYYNSIKEFVGPTDSTGWDTEINEPLQKIKKKLNAIVVLNEDIVSLIKQRINEITSSLVKIQEGKHFVGTIKKHYNNTPSLVDLCG
ncbi:MAG: hypothetical protein HRU72_05045 [Planctomycetia bacterium]|nr:hypothetical protein [Candidatus Brocadia sp.]QOJ05956.1 MAG: hypothetical protein HRU72_05045 [Planctomycetia bacterium]TVL95919.1 MAG: hypothetical protein CV082_08845 [Candidatus Brocadia sp. BL1]HQU31122.1 hypothetical protein [Candidatus Brocadia sapporoensis]